MSDIDYDGIFGVGFSFTFTPSGETPFGSAQAQAEEANTPPVTIDTAKYTPISGENSGIEQFALGRYPVQEYRMQVTYSAAAHHAALTCQATKTKGTLACTYGDGSTESYPNSAITSVAAGPNTANGLRTAEITVTCPVPPMFDTGSAITVINTTAVMTAGAVTIDLSASPYSGTGKAPIRMYLLNQSAHAITIAIGATNGYTGFGAAFSMTLQPAESVGLNGTTLIASAAKTLDVTGTAVEVLTVQVHLQ